MGAVGWSVRDQAQVGSDVDILVEFARPIDLFRFDDLQRELEALLEHQVDLVEPAALHPALRDGILSEAQQAA
jgi:uncharacterized protein